MPNGTYYKRFNAIRGARRQGLDLDFVVFIKLGKHEWIFIDAATIEPIAPVVESGISIKHKQFASYEHSRIEKPFEFIFNFLDKAPSTLRRKDAMFSLVSAGVNYSTARTQYQRWFSKNRR